MINEEYPRQMLVHSAEHISGAADHIARVVLSCLERMEWELRESRLLCKAIGIDDGGETAERLAEISNEYLQLHRRYAAELVQLAERYTDEMKKCGIPMTPVNPDLWDALTDKGFSLKGEKE